MFERIGPAYPIGSGIQGTGLLGIGYPESLIVTDKSSAYATMQRASIAHTHDGGLHWRLADDLAWDDLTGYQTTS